MVFIMIDATANKKKGKQYSNQVRISFPKSDAAVAAWVGAQFNLSSSFRTLVAKCIEEHGFGDYISATAPKMPPALVAKEDSQPSDVVISQNTQVTKQPPAVQAGTAIEPPTAVEADVQPQKNEDAASMLESMMNT
jgi:hypothetical protein